MSLFDSPAFENHEGVHAFCDPEHGLKAIIAIHSTARGPAAGGCRMWAYPDEQAAMDDALRLSRAMSYKNAVADIELGGGKAVIIGDSRLHKTPGLFESFGRAVDSLGGRYWSAEDVGISPADLAHTRVTTRYVAGLEGHPAASGDPSPVTAEGIKRGVELCVQKVYGRGLEGVEIAIQGVGHVGAYLADKLAAAGARLTIADVDEEAVREVAARTGARVVPPSAIFDVDAQVFAPCAMGGAITRASVQRLKGKIVAGGANNQLGDPEAGRLLHDRGILYAPDFVINGGGIINIAGEIRALERDEAFDPAWVEIKLSRMVETLREVLDRAQSEDRLPAEIAIETAKARIAAAKAG
jgi:leucine dehydrogenase